MLTRYTTAGVKRGAVTVYISGNRPRDVMETQKVRYAAYDGRMSDFDEMFPMNSFLSLAITGQNTSLGWASVKCQTGEKEKLKHIISTSHENGQKVRFWATPDLPGPQREAIWTQLLNVGCRFHQPR